VISLWLPIVVPVLLASVLLFVPGLVVNLGLGVRGFDAVGLAPLTSLGVLAFGTFLVPVVVRRWSLAPVAISFVLLTVIAVLGRIAISWWTGRHDPDQPENRVPLVWRVLLGYKPSVRWWMPRPRTLWWLGAVVLAAALVAANFMSGVRNPNLPSQTLDAGFHYNAVLSVMRSGFPDGGHVGAAYGSAATSWYPPLWHDVTAIVSTDTHINVAVGANAMALAIGGLVWPLSMVWLCRRILPHARRLTILALGLSCGSISLFPYLMMSFGVLWPNLLSLAALPAAIGLTLMVLQLMPRAPHARDDINSAGVTVDGASLDEAEAAQVRGGLTMGPTLSWWSVLSVGFLGCVGLFFAHPGALFALGIWAFVAVVTLSARLVISSRVRGSRNLRRSLLWLLLAWVIGAGLWASMDLVPALNAVRDFVWVPQMSMAQGLGEALTLSTVITGAHWAFGAATLWGFYRLLKVPRLRWLLASYVLVIFLYMLSAGTTGPFTRQLTGFWYDDPQRIASLIPMSAVPLCALGITSAADAIGRLVGRISSDVFSRPLSSRVALGMACVAMMALPAAIYPNQGIGEGAAVLQDRYTNLDFKNHMVTPDAQALYVKLATQIPAGGTVLASPFSGAQFSSIWSGHRVIIPIVTSNPPKDVALVSQDFKSFTTDPAVCAALKRLKVAVVVDNFNVFWPTDTRQANYSGLVNLINTPGLTPIGYGDSVTIYRVGPCES
jgi:hypothetical protein